MNKETFDSDHFLRDSKNTLLNPKSYFSGMKISGGLTEPLIKAVIYGTVTGLIYLICWLFRIKAFGAGNIGDAVGLLAVIKIIFSAAAGVSLGAGLLLIISSICKGNTNIEPNIRVSASLMVIMPVYAILSITWGINLWLGIVISILVSLFFLWLLYHGLVSALKCKQENARIVCYVLTALIVLFLLLYLRNTNNKDNIKKEGKRVLKELKK
jgi:hypothetical protein